MSKTLSVSEKLNWLRLIRSEFIGPVTFWALLERFGTANAVLNALPDLARRGGAKRSIVLATMEACEREIAAIDAYGARLIAFGEPDYPDALSRLDPAPPLITIHGCADVFHRPAIAMVGARNASALGRRFARDLAHEMTTVGFVVASGLARGIDAAAHEGALEGGTVAAMAGGVDIIYPAENIDLARRIQATGALVSEMPFGTEPQARHFPRRNRIISGLSLGVIVVEAALNSGSLITARYALEQNREVFAVPGSPLDPRARGSNDLLRQGAVLVENVEDVLAVLRPTLARPQAAPPPRPMTPVDSASDPLLQTKILALLGPAPTQIDELIRQLKAESASVAAAILELELAGRLTRHPGQQVSVS